jgi:hypothetical protein
VTADAGQTKVYGNADPGAYTFTNTSLGAGAALSGALDRAAGENVGSYAIGQGTLTSASNPNYSLTYVGDTFAVTQRPVTVTAIAGQSKVYGNADPASFGFTSTSLGTGAVLSGALDRAAGENVGGYAIGQGSLTNANNPNYLLTYAGDMFSITQRPLSIVVADANRSAATQNPPFTAAFSGFAPGEGIANLTGSLVLTTTAQLSSAAGNYPIVASGLSSPSYVLSFVGGILTVRGADVPPGAGNNVIVETDRAMRFPLLPAPAGGPPQAQCREIAPRVIDCS